MAPIQMSSLPPGIEIWIDGKSRESANASVSVLDRGFLYGDSVFETLRTYGGKPFALDEHLERLASSARRVFIELPLSQAELKAEVLEAVAQSQHDECYVRVMITRGMGALGLDPGLAEDPLRVLIVAPLSTPADSAYQNGIDVISYQTTRVNDATEAAGAKIGNYLIAVLANRQAAERGAKEALIVNAEGEVLEGATSNIFWFAGDRLLTVPLQAGILDGITRRHILKAASELGIETAESVPQLAELKASQGVFISSSIREMLPVVRIDDDWVAGGKVPPEIPALHAAFRRLVGATSG